MKTDSKPLSLTARAKAAILAAVQGTVTSTPLEVFKHVRLINSTDGFRAIGASGMIQITGRAPSLEGAEFDILVPADRIARILGTAHSDFTLTPGEKALTVKSRDSRFSLPLYLTGEFPMMAEDEIQSSIVIPSDVLSSALARVLPMAADADVARPFLTALIIEKKGADLNFVASDGAGLAWLRMEGGAADQGDFFAYAHSHTCRKLKGLLTDEDVTISVGSRMRIETGEVTIDATTFDFKRFDWRRPLRDRHTSTATVVAATAAEVLGEALIVANADKAGSIGDLVFGAQGIVVKSGTADGGGYEGTIPCVVYPGQPMNVSYSIRALQDIFAAFPRDAEVRIGYVNEAAALVFESEALPGFQSMYMPRRG